MELAVPTVDIYFSDFFDVDPAVILEYGAFNISLVNDLPLFIDPFLLFSSEKPEYQQLHASMIDYLRFLRAEAVAGPLPRGLRKAWYEFKEIPQNWLGFALEGNSGRALGPLFANSLHQNLGTIFSSFGGETVTRGSHLEKVCLIAAGVGRDNISDFTTNLIKGYLLEYSQAFARTHLRDNQRRTMAVNKVRFNYDLKVWERGTFELPAFGRDYVLLTPRDMLTRDENWINRDDLFEFVDDIAVSMPDEELREQLSRYLVEALQLNPDSTAEERRRARRAAHAEAIQRFPEIIEYYIREKEETGEEARVISDEKVAETHAFYVDLIRNIIAPQLAQMGFYQISTDTLTEAMARVSVLKTWVEDQDGHRNLYVNGEPLKQEAIFQRLFKLVWMGSISDVNREVNNGRGPADYTVSRGAADKTLIEFKLASNSKLKQNLQNQVKIYEKAADAKRSIKVICFFSAEEFDRATKIVEEVGLKTDPYIVYIDCRGDNKPSASNARDVTN